MITHEELMRYLDGELPPDRARAVEEAMEESTELRRDYVIFGRMKSDLNALGAHMRTETGSWERIERRLTRPLGWTLFVAGVLVWLAFGIYTYLTGATALWEKLAASAVVIGLAMLLASALADRWRDLRTDPYKEIER